MEKSSKVILTLALTLFIASSVLNAQEIGRGNGITKNLSLTAQFGVLQSWTDFTDDGFGNLLDANSSELGIGLLLNYKLNKVISISTGALYGKLTGGTDKVNTLGAVNEPSDLGFGILFKTNLLEITLPRVDINLTRLIFKDRSKFFNKFSIGLLGSHGLAYTNSKIYAQQDESAHLLYGKSRGRTGNTIEGVTSYGSSLSYIINDRFNLGLESTIRNVHNDKLDAWVSPGSINDKYSYTAINLTYHFKKGKSAVNKLTDAQSTPLLVEKVEEIAEIVDEVTADADKIEEIEEVTAVVEKVEEVKEEETVEVTKVLEDKPEEALAEKEDDTPVGNNSDITVYEGTGFFITVAAFRNLSTSKKVIKDLRTKGENPLLVRNKSKTWYLIAITRYENEQTALDKMKEARANGYEDAWVLYKREE
jgi:hypothetical protein